MVSKSETGHAKNVANFSQLSVTCTSFGPAHNPSNAVLQLLAMQNALAGARDCISSIYEDQGIFYRALSERNSTFKPFSKLVKRLNNAIKASGVWKQTQAQSRTIIRKLQGRRATRRMTEEGEQAAIAAVHAIVELHRRK